MRVAYPPKRRHLQHCALVILTEAKASTALRTCHPDRSAAKWSDLRSRPSPKRKTKYLCARILKFNFKGMIRDRLRLPDQLIQPLFLDRAVALFVNIAPVRCARRLTIDKHSIPNRRSSRSRPQHNMQIASMKAESNTPVGLVQSRPILA